MTRAAIFIDGGYLDKVLRNEFGGAKIQYDLLSQKIGECIDLGSKIFRTYYYHCLPYKSNPPTQEESRRYANLQSFFAALQRLPRFEVRQGRLARRGPDRDGNYTYEQKMVDVLLSIDLVSLAAKNQVTDIILIAGDSDFVPAIEIAKREGVTIWLFHGRTYHIDLWTIADERVHLDQHFINLCV